MPSIHSFSAIFTVIRTNSTLPRELCEYLLHVTLALEHIFPHTY